MEGLNNLPNETSKGPKASIGKINYNYQHFENIYNFLSIMILKKAEYSSLCIPKFKTINNNYVLHSAIIYYSQDTSFLIPSDIKKKISKCIKNGNIRFILCSLQIIFDDNYISHCNIFIIDVFKRTIERFEPYGWTLPYTKELNNIIKKNLLKHLGISTFKYIPPEKISQKLGIQTVADSFNGMCVTIACMYISLRILNPNLKQKKIIDTLLSFSKIKLKKIILRFARYIEKTLKEHY